MSKKQFDMIRFAGTCGFPARVCDELGIEVEIPCKYRGDLYTTCIKAYSFYELYILLGF